MDDKGRLKDYKYMGKDPEECRRRRQETTVQLRKVNIAIRNIFLFLDILKQNDYSV